MVSKLYCQLKALYNTAPLGATNSIKFSDQQFQFVFLVYCVLLLGTWLQADFGICVTFLLVLTSEKKKLDQNLGYKLNPLVWTLFGRLKSKFLKK